MATVLQFDQLAPMLRAIPSLPRPVLASLTERLIERMDEIDGDADLEPEVDHGAEDFGEPDEFRPDGFEVAKPLYALDQTLGPINVAEARREHYRHISGVDR